MMLLIGRKFRVSFRLHLPSITKIFQILLKLLINFVTFSLASPTSHLSFLSWSFVNSFFLELTAQTEIIDILNSLRPGTAAGCDKVTMWSVKESANFISEPLTHMVNLFIESGIVPDQMKIARVIRLFKSGDNNLFTNYRSVSVLPIFPKLFERVVYNRLIKYFDKYDILFNNQFGFRKNHSPSLALLNLLDKITSAIDQEKYTTGVFLDLSKAFHTVNHSILFDKLEYYGIRGLALEWIKNYFCNRVQYVEYDGTSSSPGTIKCGVPQGSILGPLFFLIYINDLCNASNVIDLVLFADDTNLFFSHNDLSYLMETINSEMIQLSNWFLANKLSINDKKSNFMIFKPRQNRQKIDLKIEINSYRIEQVREVVFLGVIMDEHISWKPHKSSHISHIASKISKSIGIISRSSFYLSKSALLTLYYSLFLPYIQYCILVWGSTYSSNLNRIALLQKRVVRIINKEKFDAHTDPIFKELKILKLHDIYLFHLGKFMYLFKIIFSHVLLAI